MPRSFAIFFALSILGLDVHIAPAADALNPMPARVLVQLARLRRIVADAEQIIDRVLILLPAQAIKRHRWPRRHPCRPALFEPRIEAADEPRDFVLRRPFLVLRRHGAGIDLLDHFRPMMRISARMC